MKKELVESNDEFDLYLTINDDGEVIGSTQEFKGEFPVDPLSALLEKLSSAKSLEEINAAAVEVQSVNNGGKEVTVDSATVATANTVATADSGTASPRK